MNNGDPFIFLVDTLFSIYITIMYLRFILQQVGADFYNPISQFIVKATQPLVKNARRIIPSVGRIDTATLVLTLLLIILKTFLLYGVLSGGVLSNSSINFLALLLLSLRDIISLTFNIFIFAIFIQAILSWINPDPYNPISTLLYSITYPVLRPIQQRLPPMGGLDLSSLVALIGLMFLKLLVLKFF